MFFLYGYDEDYKVCIGRNGSLDTMSHPLFPPLSLNVVATAAPLLLAIHLTLNPEARSKNTAHFCF
jgi:hypothetical protein